MKGKARRKAKIPIIRKPVMKLPAFMLSNSNPMMAGGVPSSLEKKGIFGNPRLV